MTDTPHFALIAGELSGDLLGAALIRALRQRYPQARFSGVAGPRMLAEGCEAVASIETLSVMGLAEVLPAIPRLLRLRRMLVNHYSTDRPAVLIGIDAPDFNLGLEARLKRRGLRTVHLVSPTVWAWREGRVQTIAKAVERILCLFPFEPAVYAKYGVAAAYIGHPLADELDDAVSPAAGKAALGLDPARPVLALLPGSRGGEVSRLAEPFARAAARLAEQIPGLQVLTPVAKPALRSLLAQARQQYAPALDWRLLDGQSREAMRAADAVLLASGTATLECLLLGRPMVVGYRLSGFSAWLLRRLLKVSSVSLPNLLSGQDLVPELLQEDCTPERLTQALLPLLQGGAAAGRQTAGFAAVRAELRRDSAAQAAAAIAELLSKTPSVRA